MPTPLVPPSRHRTRRRLLCAGLALAGLLLAACGSDDDAGSSTTAPGGPDGSGGSSSTDAPTGPRELRGTFEVAAGTCDAKGVTGGSYIRLVLPGGTVADGPYFANPDSGCAVKTTITVAPGTDGGLVTGSYQPAPVPPFDAKGGSRAASIIAPQSFTAIDFSASTDEKGPNTGEAAEVPTITVEDGKLSGDLSALSASWNNEFFNQGAPKPDGSRPGLTQAVTGTYDEATDAYVLDWASQVVGGPFNDFTGVWHLEGTFEPAS